ncbi:MAG: MBL fold metallo-hydrolase [Burkholderiales bacterium]|nr:MBL fold metallo-hydrolase [Burkholderiales bacterium]
MPDVHPSTLRAHRALAEALPFADTQDFEDARRGFVGTIPDARVESEDGRTIWDMAPYRFLDDPAPPDTVNPSLWRQARLNTVHGLFEVCERTWQVRGLDIANMTILEGDTGLIVIDPLTGVEVARAALELYFAHRPRRPVHTVIYSHSHADHFGGVKGVVDEADVRAGRVQVIAPARFMEAAVSENLLAGVPMARRGQYQFGPLLPKGPAAQVDAGLGKTTSLGRLTLIAPTRTIVVETEAHRIDCVEIVFQLTPESEAPAEMHFWFPQWGALNLAENATHTLHNVCPIRGAQARDALLWSKYLDRALARWGDAVEVVYAQHHWPIWGNARCRAFVAEQRDLYRYLHDQTVRMMSHGWRPAEIAEMMKLPPGLEARWHARGYYGTVSHNVKAIYQRHLSWYDGNPANLNPLPPVDAGRRTVEYMGGVDAMLARAAADFERGEFRWVAQVLSHAVFAHPERADVRLLAARAMEQLAFQAESATWRNAYLMGAKELREGTPPPGRRNIASTDMVRAMTLEMFFDFVAVRLNAHRAAGLRMTLDWVFPDVGERWRCELSNSALTARAGTDGPPPDATVTVDRATLDAFLMQRTSPAEAVAAGLLRVDGPPGTFARFWGLLDRFEPIFPIVEPHPDAFAPRP